MKFNEKLIDLRKKAGLSQEELGYKLNVTRQTVSKWELGQTTPEMDKLIEIGKIFNISVDELVNEEEAVISQNQVIEDQTIDGTETNGKTAKIIGIIILTIVLVLIISWIAFGFTIFNKVIGTSKNVKENLFDRVFGLVDKTIENQENMLEEQGNIFQDVEKIFQDANNEVNITKFNGGIKAYNGTQNGTRVKTLLDNVITSNKTKDKKITVKYLETKTEDTEEILKLKDNFDSEKNYEVSFEYDDKGYIAEVKVERIITKFEISSFNNSIEIFQGTKMGATVKSAIDAIIKSNNREDIKITVKYMDLETQDEVEIRDMKKNFDNFSDFEVYFEYDADGFINKAIIEKL